MHSSFYIFISVHSMSKRLMSPPSVLFNHNMPRVARVLLHNTAEWLSLQLWICHWCGLHSQLTWVSSESCLGFVPNISIVTVAGQTALISACPTFFTFIFFRKVTSTLPPVIKFVMMDTFAPRWDCSLRKEKENCAKNEEAKCTKGTSLMQRSDRC